MACGVCNDNIDSSESSLPCPACDARYHKDCWNYNTGCGNFSCEEVILHPPVDDGLEAIFIDEDTEYDAALDRNVLATRECEPQLYIGMEDPARPHRVVPSKRTPAPHPARDLLYAIMLTMAIGSVVAIVSSTPQYHRPATYHAY